MSAKDQYDRAFRNAAPGSTGARLGIGGTLNQGAELDRELHDDHATLKTAFDALRLYVISCQTGSDAGTGTNLAIGTTTTEVQMVNPTQYKILGEAIIKAATDDLWTLTGSNVSNSGDIVGGWYLLLDASGTASVQRCAADATTAAGLTWPTPTADRAVIGTVTVSNGSGGDFIPGTTALNAGSITTTYTEGLGLAGALAAVLPAGPATLTATKPTDLTP
jgi:hypothetical protein